MIRYQYGSRKHKEVAAVLFTYLSSLCFVLPCTYNNIDKRQYLVLQGAAKSKLIDVLFIDTHYEVCIFLLIAPHRLHWCKFW